MELKDYREKTIKAKDKITGFEGIVTGHADYITGCDQYILQPPSKDGEFKEARWFDENRIEILNSEESILSKKKEGINDNGADIPAPIK